MTVENFNEKYKNYLEEGHYGLSLGDDEFIEWLDEQFEINGDLIMIDPNELREYNYYEETIINKTLIDTIAQIQNKLRDTNITIYLFPMLE